MSDPATDDLDVLAHWWLPENPKRRIAGRLTWNADRGGDLELLGELREPLILDNQLSDGRVQKYRAALHKADQRYPVIHGSRTTSSGSVEAYTLLHSLSLNNIGFHGLDELPEHISAGAVLHGAWYTDPHDVEADRAVFDLRHLSAWVNTSGLKTKFPAMEGDSNGPDTVIKGHRQPSVTIEYEDATVSFVQRLNHTGDFDHASGIQQTWQLMITIDPMGELEVFTDIATDIRALVTIAAGKTADIERAVLQHPKLHKYRGDGTAVPAFRDDITYFSRWAHRAEDMSAVRRHDLYFTLEDFGGADGVKRWLQTARTYRTELRRVMATRYTDTMYLEDRIMNTCAALERFDKERRPNAPKVRHGKKLEDPWFVERIEECVDYAGNRFKDLIVDEPGTWAEHLRDARNQLAHHDDPFRTTGEVGEYLLAEQAYWLFAMCLLRACAAPESTFDSICRHQQISWLQSEAATRSARSTAGPN